MNKKLHVGNLPSGTTDQDLLEKFARFGGVEFAAIVKDDLSGESCGFGLVEMNDSAGALEAIKWLNFSSYEGHIMSVAFFEAGGSTQ